jgi:hypothetical protein
MFWVITKLSSVVSFSPYFKGAIRYMKLKLDMCDVYIFKPINIRIYFYVYNISINLLKIKVFGWDFIFVTIKN